MSSKEQWHEIPPLLPFPRLGLESWERTFCAWGRLGVLALGHDVRFYEPKDAWSVRNLRQEHGEEPITRFRKIYPALESIPYDLTTLDLDRAVHGADAVIVHEWNEADLVNALGQLRRRSRKFRLYFHDTHHRLLMQPEAIARLDLSCYDGVLAYGKVLRDLYRASGRVRKAWTWHEAADTRVFRPLPPSGESAQGDLIWIGNWGDDERSEELHEFLISPVKALALKARVHGVRYPEAARAALADAGIEYAGWLPNFDVPQAFAQFRLTVHVPRRPYVQALPGIPTIRVFEALACGIPMICSPWEDAEHLFEPGQDFLIARNGKEMVRQLELLLENPNAARALARHGLETIRARHTCAHRVSELLQIISETRID